jgi:hypothetical protein
MRVGKDIKIDAQEVKRLLLKTYKQYKSDLINESKAYKEAYILNTVLKVIEVTNIEDRLKSIGEILRNGA